MNKFLYDERLLKALKNMSFRLEFIQNPKQALKNHFNIDVPEDLDIKVHVDAENIKNFVLPATDGKSFALAW